MKGLATYDSKLAIVHVGLRVARKHYGVRLSHKYRAAVHEKDSR
jgi:hypothetical protein